jgi:hypothetical protein
MTRRRFFIIALLLVTLAGSVVTWAQSSSSLSFSISAAGTDGQVVTGITSIGETFSITQGKAQKVSGVELYKIELGSAQFSNLIRINLALLNPQDIGKVLNNPNSFIEVSVYYPGTGDGQVTLDYDGTTAIPDNGDMASAMMSRVIGDVLLFPSVTGQSTLYILASINTPAGPPPGQQEQLTDLEFYIDVRMNSAP